MVVEGYAGADDVDQCRSAMAHRSLDQRHQLLLVAGKTASDIRRAQLQRQRHEVDRRIVVDDATLALRPLVGCRRELALGQSIHTIVGNDVGHVDATTHGVRELAQYRSTPSHRHLKCPDRGDRG